ncbi:hypothetical protein C5167_031911 [Papaver somniferum]|uniref:Uncharacterized protein n=1 Tax=Papaver somniferum TaxID=3469 RepID=A0A4Y7K909_PAPSO|nr:hypothetical protein C5167_031911 [Papaver somniferum]
MMEFLRKFGHTAATTFPHKKNSNNSSASLRNIMWISPMLRCANDEDCPSSFRVTDSEVDSKAEVTEGSSFKLTVSIGCV